MRTAYLWRVTAYNSAGESAPSNNASATTGPGVTIPQGPDDTKATQLGRLVNISTRAAFVGGEPMIAGFVVVDGPVTVLLRGAGPSLASFGVPNPLVDPQIQMIGGPANNDWTGADVAAAAAQVGAFAFPAGSKDAALLVTLAPGSYTVHLTSADGGSGVALVEVYHVPSINPQQP